MRTKFLVEMLGTMVLVLMGSGAAVMKGGAISVAAVLTIAFAFGLSVVAMAYTIGTISGCHINPAVTVGVWLSGRMPASEAGVYILAQVIGGVLGSAILCVVTGMMGLEGTGANSFGESHLAGALVAEAVFTFVFVLVVLGCTDSRNNNLGLAGLAIGLALVLVHIVCIPLTGTSVNPARSIGPAIFAGGTALEQLWVFIVAPLAGAVIAATVWKAVRG